MESEDKSSNLRVASFSYYLKTPEESLVQRELSIFGADKYFDLKMDYENGLRKEGLHRLKPNVTPRTPSISSEASSWNSQRSLLQRNPSHAKQSREIGKRFFFFPSFGCHGPCSTKKAVYVNETLNLEFKKEEQFAFPVLNPKMEDLSTAKKQFEEEGKILEDDPQRKSLEVFGSDTHIKKGSDIAKNLERKLSILTWDAIPKAQDNISSSTTYGSSSAICDDMASDASSDLFEIENISRMSSCMSPPTQYAPSEASIEWSVVTASAAEFSSVYSDYDGLAGDRERVLPTTAYNKTAKNKAGTGKSQKTRPSGLLGCRSNKAVRVTESVYKTTDKLKHN